MPTLDFAWFCGCWCDVVGFAAFWFLKHQLLKLVFLFFTSPDVFEKSYLAKCINSLEVSQLLSHHAIFFRGPNPTWGLDLYDTLCELLCNWTQWDRAVLTWKDSSNSFVIIIQAAVLWAGLMKSPCHVIEPRYEWIRFPVHVKNGSFMCLIVLPDVFRTGGSKLRSWNMLLWFKFVTSGSGRLASEKKEAAFDILQEASMLLKLLKRG